MTRRRSMRGPRRDSDRIRRDPRAERDYLIEEKKEKPTEPAANARQRRDPRAARAAGNRRRIERNNTATAAPARQPGTPAAPQIERVIIDNPTYWVLAVPDLDDAGKLNAHDRDVFGAARALADTGQGAVVAVVFDGQDDLGGAGADRVVRFDAGVFHGYAPEARVQALAALFHTLQPRHVVLPDTSTGGGDIGRRLAALLNEPIATQVQRIDGGRITARGNGGRSDFLLAPPRLILLAAEAADPVTGKLFEARAVEPPSIQPQNRVEDLGPVPVDPNAIALKEADFIVSAGNGVSDWEAFHHVARTLGATEGGSRVVCDAGLLARERQVGASGTLVDPRCYLAFGIAGAPQHLQGITRCERVVAVNTDLHADMIKRADLAIVADAQQVMPALTRLLEEKNDGD